QLDLRLDNALQETRTVGQAVAVAHELLERRRRHFQGPSALRKRAFDPCDLMERDRPHFVLRQRPEYDDLVDTIPELRRESPFEFSGDLPVDLLDRNLLRVESERTAEPAEALGPHVRC